MDAGDILEDLTASQSEALIQFRQNVKDVLKPSHDDHYLLRWLKARNFNLLKAEQMLRKSLTWRQELQVDTLVENWQAPEVLTKYFPGSLYGHTKRGQPVWYEPVGCLDPKGIFSSARKSDVLKLKIQHSEQIRRAVDEQYAKTKRRVGFIIVLDLEHFGMKHLTQPVVDSLSNVLTVFEANYPESKDMTYVINAPRIFPVVFNMFKRFLSEDTRNKVQLLGQHWKEKLLEVIDADQLPVYWGGNATGPDGDIYCVNMGGEVPKHYYSDQLGGFDPAYSKKVTVGWGSSIELHYVVDVPGSVLSWEFVTEGGDIGFEVREKDADYSAKSRRNIDAAPRVNSHLVTEVDSITCDKTGTYIVRFDNRYSWMKSKTVTYIIKVLKPDSLQHMHVSPSFDFKH